MSAEGQPTQPIGNAGYLNRLGDALSQRPLTGEISLDIEKAQGELAEVLVDVLENGNHQEKIQVVQTLFNFLNLALSNNKAATANVAHSLARHTDSYYIEHDTEEKILRGNLD